ncbi:long-chain fatty acid--CoA ligase [Candidatus Pelagibacter sp.]|nr:long-chain fatty acid--CoA ligase [Candidatus Pelagibacter sp.]
MNLKKYNNLVELFFEQCAKQNKDQIFLTSLKDPKKSFSWKDVETIVLKLASEISKSIQKGERCLLISENRPEWMISDLAIMLAGGISVPAYTTYVERDYEYIINDCSPSVVIVSNDEQFNKVRKICEKNSFIKKIFSFEKLSEFDQNNYINLQNLINSQIKNDVINFKNNSKRSDPACIIYTSGTQGNPKGVILSHGGILSNCEGGYEILKPILNKKTRFLTWLPLSHSYEHAVQFVQIAVGAEVYYAESIDKLIKNMSDCSPHIMTAVPRFYQNLHQKINATFSKATGYKKILVNNTLRLGAKKLKKENMSISEKFMNLIVERLVRSKIKNQFGGSLKAFVSGGGALDKEIGTFLNAIGLPTLQGYGLTETSPVVSCNPLDDIRIETVGIPFKCNEVKIADDGEILVKGENVMLGYWNNQNETEKVLKNGWLHTGDIGKFENNYLKITDRKKDILITPGGDNISPLKIENMLTSCKMIDQAIVYGDYKPYLVALIILNKEYENKKENLDIEIEKINNNLTKVEKIKKYFIIKENFTIENGMMTPTLKLKRFKIINKYEKEFKNLY